MLMTKMVSVMKHTKDRMDNPMLVAEIMQLLDTIKSTGATHVEVSTVIGHPNFVAHSELWANWIHTKGMKVTWRNAHINMEGLYNQPRFVGGNRKPVQFWIDEAVKAAQALRNIVQSGDEWAIYPERTEGIFSNNDAWIFDGLPESYAQAFVAIHTACAAVLTPGTKVGLSANNASELLSGWMPRSLIDYAGTAVVDHYRDGNPAQYEQEIRAISAKYGKPVYVQEGAPHRFIVPSKAESDAYYAVNKKLADENILVGFGSWSGWAGAPESIINGDFTLNDNGLSLKNWWDGSPMPDPTPDPDPLPDPDPIPNPELPGEEKIVQIQAKPMSVLIGLSNKGKIYKYNTTTSEWELWEAPAL